MVPTLDSRLTLEALYFSLLFTLVRLKLDPRLQPFVPVFEQLRAAWVDVCSQEHDLIDARLQAEAKVDYVDAELDRTSDGIASAILLETKNNRKALLFVRYFGSQQPSRFRKSVLGPQLTAMRTWVPSLTESPIPALSAYAGPLAAQIQAADQALALASVAEQKITDFRMFGERKQLFDKVNGARKQLHGDVSKMIHEHPEWSLTRDYVNALFEHDSAPPELSIAELNEKIQAANSEAAKLTALREQRIADEQAEAAERAEAEKKAKLAVIEAAEKAAAQAAARVAALKADLSPAA
ncbi:MAG TPA: hypothetical protein VE093_29345 [Polyangiaceae bacterium]|jgi:hypothetical protein|nr:hypothetical protein [Polyangiaceae bacterium]